MAMHDIVPALLDFDLDCYREALIKLYSLTVEFKQIIQENAILRDIVRSTACLEYRIDTRAHVRVPRARVRVR